MALILAFWLKQAVRSFRPIRKAKFEISLFLGIQKYRLWIQYIRLALDGQLSKKSIIGKKK